MNRDAKMRDTPLDENEIARLQMLQASGKAPANPKWYTPPRTPATFKFKAGAAPAFPAHVRPNPIRKPEHVVLPCTGGPYAGQGLDVSAFGKLSTLVFSVGAYRGYYERAGNGKALAWVAQPADGEDLV